MYTPNVSKDEVKSKLIKTIESSVTQIATDIVQDYFKASPEIAKVKAIDGYNFQSYVLGSNNYINPNTKGSFIWGKSTWGIDSISVNNIIEDGEYNPYTRTGVMKRDEFKQ